MKPVVAFLQNMWVREPEPVRRQIERHGEPYRLRFMAHVLFAGCTTGRRLRLTFGEELIEQILWEETTREIGGSPRTIFPAQPAHIRTVLAEHKPKVVVTFGRIAADALPSLWNGLLICAPHPCARVPEMSNKLKAAAEQLREYLKL